MTLPTDEAALRAAAAILHRPVCDLLDCTYPIVLAGMGGVARAELVAAVSQAGGFGFLGMVREPPELIRAEVAQVRARSDRKFGVNVIPAATDAALLEAQIDVCLELAVPVVGLFWDVPPALVRRLNDAGVLVVCQIGSADEARAAQDAGAAILIAQGREAGGHVRGTLALATLLPEVLAAVQVPVLGAGGMADGVDVAMTLSLGAQGAVLGTAFIATHESYAHVYHKQRIVEAGGETLLTDAFHINWPRGARVRVLPNSVTQGERGDPFAGPKQVIGEDAGRPIHLFSTDSPLRSTTGDLEAMALYAGEAVGRIASLCHAHHRLLHIARDAAAHLSVAAPPAPVPARNASPVCYAEEADAAYMGYAGREELLAALNELLEAERAGARVALDTRNQLQEAPLRQLMEGIRRDEVKWCGVLIAAIQSLDAKPSTHTGAFHGKAMAIQDLVERMTFLNRGQNWVVRKLQALVPRVREARIQSDLAAMLSSHQENIARVQARLEAGG